MAEKKKILYIVEAMGGGVFTYMEEIRFSHLHGLQRQRPQGRIADEVLKRIFSAKRHLQAVDAS